MDYSFILRQLQAIPTNNYMIYIGLGLIILFLLIFLISKTFRKTGLLLLIFAFGIDYTIKKLPFNIYDNYPQVYNGVTVLYVLGFLVFFVKVFKMLVKKETLSEEKEVVKKSKLKDFLNFSGISPFMLMLVINILNYKNFIPKDIIRLATSISFLYMVFKTTYSTYKYLSNKDNILINEKMNFKEIKDFLNEDEKEKKSPSQSKNQGRRIRKSEFSKNDDDPTDTIDSKKIKEELLKSKIDDKEEKIEVPINKIKEDEFINKLSNTDLLKIISMDSEDYINLSTMTITNLSTKEKLSYTSDKAKFKIQENDQYKIDLEFKTFNEYDYGRFIDILIEYAKDKDAYKFELEISPKTKPFSKVVFFDPSNIFDIDQMDYANVGGKNISMNFPKYKINFISGN